MSSVKEAPKRDTVIISLDDDDPFSAVKVKESSPHTPKAANPLAFDENPDDLEESGDEDQNIEEQQSAADSDDSGGEKDVENLQGQPEQTEDEVETIKGDDDEVVSGEETEEQSGDDANLYYYVGQELKNDGFLPEDMELSEDVDGMEVYEAYKNKLKADLEPAILTEINQKLADQGYTEQDLLVARAIRQGVDPRLLSTASMYERYSQMDDEVEDASKEAVISQYFRSRGFNDDEINVQLETAHDDEKLDDLYTKSRKYFAGKYKEFEEAEKERVKSLEGQAAEAAEQANALISKVLTRKKIGDVEMSSAQAKSFGDAIRKQSEIVDVSGQKYRATELQKFLYDFQTDDELKLKTFFFHKFRDQHQDEMKTKAKQEVEKEFLSGYKSRVIKGKTGEKKDVKKRLEDTKKKENTIFLDFSDKK